MFSLRTLTLGALALACSSAATLAAVLAGPVVNPANGHRYYLLAPDNFAGAEAEAVAMGGHLVTINDAAEDQWVYETFGATALAAEPSGGLKWLRIGLNDEAQEGTYVWSSGEISSYTNYQANEPAGGAPDEDYIAIGLTLSPGKWHDLLSDARAGDIPYGVVEIPQPLLNPAQQNQLRTWIGAQGATFTSIFRNDRTGTKTAADFHAAADRRGPTVSVMEVINPQTGQVVALIGGFNPNSWDAAIGHWITDTLGAARQPFLFNLTTGTALEQRTDTYGPYETYHVPQYGPTFGGGHDLYVDNSLHGATCMAGPTRPGRTGRR
jgi:hypothetical protein